MGLVLKSREVTLDIENLAYSYIKRGYDKKKIKKLIYDDLALKYAGETYRESHLVSLINEIVERDYAETDSARGRPFLEILDERDKKRYKEYWEGKERKRMEKIDKRIEDLQMERRAKKYIYDEEKKKREKQKRSFSYRFLDPISSHVSGVLGTILLLIIGMAISAIIGSYLFFFAFACWAVYNMIPDPRDEFNPIERKVKEIEKKLARGEIEPAVAESISKTELAIMELRREKNHLALMKHQFGKRGVKHSFRMGGFVLFTLAFATAPLLKPIAVVIALIAYFMVE